MKLTTTDFAESPSIDLFLFQNCISEAEANNKRISYYLLVKKTKIRFLADHF